MDVDACLTGIYQFFLSTFVYNPSETIAVGNMQNNDVSFFFVLDASHDPKWDTS